MLVDIGEIYCDGNNPSGQPWSVGVDRPIDGNQEKGAQLSGVWSSGGAPVGIVTSGNYRKFYIRDGRKYAHTINPHTGKPAQSDILSATVIAPSCAIADAYATAFMVLGSDKAKEILKKHPELKAYFILSDYNIWQSM
jgi:thiamine biosynthesis lipoprotein